MFSRPFLVLRRRSDHPPSAVRRPVDLSKRVRREVSEVTITAATSTRSTTGRRGTLSPIWTQGLQTSRMPRNRRSSNVGQLHFPRSCHGTRDTLLGPHSEVYGGYREPYGGHRSSNVR